MRKFFSLTCALFGIACAHALAATPVRAQDDSLRVEVDTSRAGTGWDAPRVRSLIERATERRMRPRADTALHNYSASAEGFVYFFLDRRDTDERTLIRVHQIGLELFWKQPGISRQRIAGLRDVSPLPNTQRYHLDHLTMVQNGFGDVIRVGDGDEVGDVAHPASAMGESIYQFRLSDSLDIQLGPGAAPIRVYEIQVRPRRPDRPGFVGSIYVDRETADIVRMTFTFTASSYVDKRLDYINLSLDNGLWEGKYWLPNQQTVEIRRQIPQLEFVAGTVIRGRMRIHDYKLNTELPDSLFRQGRAVVSATPEELAAYPFRQGIYDDIADAGLTQSEETANLRAQAAALIGARLLSGLPPVRFFYPDISSGIRYNRAEGLFLGLGLTYNEGPPWHYDAAAGYAFAPKKPSFLARATYATPAINWSLNGYTRAIRDLGPVSAVNGVANSLSSMFLGKDYLDPWFASGVSTAAVAPLRGTLNLRVGMATELQRNAALAVAHPVFDGDKQFRTVRSIDEGNDYSLTAAIERGLPTSGLNAWGASLSARAARFTSENGSLADLTYVKPELRVDFVMRTVTHVRELRATAAASTVSSGAPAQHYFTLGGLGTLPGYAYREFAGRTGAFASAEFTQRVFYPFVGIRAIAATGATMSFDATPATPTWSARGSDGLRSSAGLGLSLFWDIAHVDVIKGLNGGHWAAQVSFTRILDNIS